MVRRVHSLSARAPLKRKGAVDFSKDHTASSPAILAWHTASISSRITSSGRAGLLNDCLIREQFQGAYYELIVANTLVRAGFSWSSKMKQTAIRSTASSQQYRGRPGRSTRLRPRCGPSRASSAKPTQTGQRNDEPLSHLSHHVTAALKKPASDDRLIFAHVKAPFTLGEGARRAWIGKSPSRLGHVTSTATAKRTPTSSSRICPSIACSNDDPIIIALPMGLGMPEFNRPGIMRVIEAHRSQAGHIDIYNVCEFAREISRLPIHLRRFVATPSKATLAAACRSARLISFEGIGGPDGTVGTVTSATVNVAEKKAYIAITRIAGRRFSHP